MSWPLVMGDPQRSQTPGYFALKTPDRIGDEPITRARGAWATSAHADASNRLSDRLSFFLLMRSPGPARGQSACRRTAEPPPTAGALRRG
jgi:hypothetical protein